MDKLKKIFLSKKVMVALIAFILEILAANGIVVPPEWIDLFMKAVFIIAGAFCGGQGLADGLSRGKTSAQSNGTDATDLVDMIGKLGLRLTTPRKSKTMKGDVVD